MESVAPQTTAVTLWKCICSRTDEVYHTLDGMQPVYEKVMRALGKEVGLSDDALDFAPNYKVFASKRAWAARAFSSR